MGLQFDTTSSGRPSQNSFASWHDFPPFHDAKPGRPPPFPGQTLCISCIDTMLTPPTESPDVCCGCNAPPPLPHVGSAPTTDVVDRLQPLDLAPGAITGGSGGGDRIHIHIHIHSPHSIHIPPQGSVPALAAVHITYPNLPTV